MLESIAFTERLSASHTLAVSEVESVLSDLRTAVHTHAATKAPGPTGPTTLPATLATHLTPALSRTQLSWQHLPTHNTLRYNQDLATRPGWYPPTPGSVTLAPALWWERRGAHAAQGRGQCEWWTAPHAAESAHACAVEIRTQQAAAVRARWCVAHALGCLLRDCADAGVSAAQQASVTDGSTPVSEQVSASQAVTELGRVLGCPDSTPLHQWLQAQAQQSTEANSSTETSETTLLLPLATCAVLAAAQALSDAAVAQDTTSSLLQSACDLLSTAVTSVCGRLQGTAALPVVPGDVLCVCTSLVTEGLSWLVALMQVSTTHIHTHTHTYIQTHALANKHKRRAGSAC